MPIFKGNNYLNELKIFLEVLFNKEYPEFIYKNCECKEIPVFCYHHVTKDEFESHLHHLYINKYKTLIADEFYSQLLAENGKTEHSVLLTFDDGLSDLYDVVFPIIQKYQMKIVVFLIPGWVGKEGVLTWDQIKELHNSGLVDFQSHSVHHQAIFTSSQVTDFYNPSYETMKLWNIPAKRQNNKNIFCEEPIMGSPIYEHHSRFSEHKQYLPDEKIQNLCNDNINQNGEFRFFITDGWREKLTSLIDEYRKNNEISDSFETEEDQRKNIHFELEESQKLIEEKLSGKKVRYFACPWNETSIITQEILKEIGYKISFVGMRLELEQEEHNNFFTIKRISGDFVRCLSGKERKSLLNVMLSKIFRRIRSGVNY